MRIVRKVLITTALTTTLASGTIAGLPAQAETVATEKRVVAAGPELIMMGQSAGGGAIMMGQAEWKRIVMG
ncbi:hypothetical protein C1I98_29320 [Spongiactinospora gelatinilytica]|uniref:Uncharacterized protein n=1 Tax=Spongiactinospora gelatinilytica TaxID=2666298 RepID=A0A2W2G4W4_9ACTN|nr:hypothetical protein [Spongiactinospora gelatinilytica]PZG32460.1 hypothetical protein C1I98_29320 [Spongiactinospora gelatinilytica]